MRRTVLNPTEDNIMKSLEENIFGRNMDLNYFLELLSNIEGPYSLALNGAWGSGKTFFIKQAEMVLNAYNNNFDMDYEQRDKVKNTFRINDSSLQELQCIYYDAWKNDSGLDPIYSLIYSITGGYEHFKGDRVDKDKMISLGIEIVSALIPLVPSVAMRGILSRIPVEKIRNQLKSENPLDPVKKQLELEEKTREFFGNLNAGRENNLIIFIDELDRCRPDFAVQLLERIKHYFDSANITFVFSVNLDQLVHTIKKFYGSSFEAGRYLGRFFDQVVQLPKPNLSKYYQSAQADGSLFFDQTVRNFIESFQLSLRDIANYIHMEKTVKDSLTKQDDFSNAFRGHTGTFLNQCIIPLLIGVNVIAPETFNALIAGENKEKFIQLVEKTAYMYVLKDDIKVVNERQEIIKRDASIESGLEAIYRALFDPEFKDKDVIIGSYKFTEGDREFVRKTAALLSGYASYKN